MENMINYAKEIEKEGANFYIELALKADHLLTKKLLYTLSKQEIEHLEAIEEFLTLGKYEIKYESKIEDEMKKFFSDIKEKSKIETQLNGYEVALELEKKSYLLYEKFYNSAKNEQEKKLYEFLMNQERQHIEAIVNVYSYLSETGDWFQKEESRIWNWMNL